MKIQVEFNPAYISQYRLIGYKNRALAEQDFADDKVDAGDIGAGHQVTAIYEVVPAGTKGWIADRRYTDTKAATGKQDGEMAFVRLRYKLPDGDTSRLIERPVAAAALATHTLPQGDMAFATAVAAFGQKLRGDTRLGDIGFGDIRRLAGNPDGYWRQEFVKLTELAEAGTRPGKRVVGYVD
ncbi:MAG: Ca-activated chloride channel [Sphingomonas bacterium]|uniref:YfbK domain-containing protein n=1 Tax=Sphingomonas bacterium TaxID=1895847 RepID=UPI002615E8BC|nr:YfbK domain-containing protein [Sphingomonas bacterium]MDB5705821.1 Ca-activated chloride channel [Sphingomonas bacterium]